MEKRKCAGEEIVRESDEEDYEEDT